MASTGVYDEKVYDAEKQQLEAHQAHNGTDPRFPGKTNEYAIEVAPAGAAVHDAVFGDMGEGGPNYRAVSDRAYVSELSLTA